MKARVITMSAQGEPSVMDFATVEMAPPGPGEVQVRQTAIGLNYIDTYHRSGLYPMALPSGIGVEAAGVVESVGEDVSELAPGDRVAYGGGAPAATPRSATSPPIGWCASPTRSATSRPPLFS